MFIEGLIVRNLLCVPIMDHKAEVIAVLITYNKPWSFTKLDLDHMFIVAQCAGIVLRKAQMFQELRDSQRMEQAIAKLSKEIYKSIEGGDLLAVLNRLSGLVQETLDCEKVTIFLMDGHEREVRGGG